MGIIAFVLAPAASIIGAETNDPIITALRELEQNRNIVDPFPEGKVLEIHFAVLPGLLSPLSYRMSVGRIAVWCISRSCPAKRLIQEVFRSTKAGF